MFIAAAHIIEIFELLSLLEFCRNLTEMMYETQKKNVCFNETKGSHKILSEKRTFQLIDFHVYFSGIFPPASDVTDVNATCRTSDYKLIASGDDFGQVKIFRYPVFVC